MQCERCGGAMEPEEAHEHAGRMICEDCYMDVLSPARSCDPWAVYTATRLKEQEPTLNPAQEKILECIDRLGAPTPDQVLECTGLDEMSLQREFASLRHMELLRAAPRPGGGKVLLRFDAPDPGQ